MAKKTKEKTSSKAANKPVAEEKGTHLFKNIFNSVKNEIGQFIVGLVLALIAFYIGQMQTGTLKRALKQAHQVQMGHPYRFTGLGKQQSIHHIQPP